MIGRPQKYKPEFLDSIIACGMDGKSVVSRCCEIGIRKQTYYNWIDPDSEFYIPEFAEAHEIAEMHCAKWWEEKGQRHLTFDPHGERLDPQNYRLQMMNRFGWSEKGQQEVNGKLPVTIIMKGPDETGEETH